MSKTSKAIEAARQRLRAAIDRACIARGEAQWHLGYRTGRYASLPQSAAYEELYAKEQAIWRQCGIAEKKAERAMRSYALAIRRSFNPIRKRKP